MIPQAPIPQNQSHGRQNPAPKPARPHRRDSVLSNES
jgi:hypothetical protein